MRLICLASMNREARQYLLVILMSAAFGIGVWALLRFTPRIRHANQSARPATQSADLSNGASLGDADPDLWSRSMEKVKEDRAETEKVALEIPPELRHYEDRHWFLATQVAEVKKINVPPAQALIALAAPVHPGKSDPAPLTPCTNTLFRLAATQSPARC